MKAKTFFLPVIALATISFLSGCRIITLPGGEPFGEHTYSNDQAQSVYESVCAKMEKIGFSDWNGYSVEIDDNFTEQSFYRTDEYTLLWYEEAKAEYLWYQGRLYCYDKETLSYRDIEWSEILSDDYAAQQWEFAIELLAQKPEKLKYKFIPMSSGNQYLLTAEYSQSLWEDKIRQFPKLYFRLDEKKNFSGLTVHWQEETLRVVNIGYFPFENSTDLQAERKIWSFAHELGLIEKGVPALSTQKDDREGCKEMINGIDFDSLTNSAVCREDMIIPLPE